MKILVIDDDAAVRTVIGKTLTTGLHTVLEADNGKTGLRLLEEHRDISVMITDLIMPEKDGIETILEVRTKYPAIRILAISGGGVVGADKYLALAKALGAHAILKKPFSGRELMQAIEKL
jgi:CheY-like chemotaxis protein